jgi:hydroxymethylpyrimidine/phosphomethylpyrimidine kinase
MTREPARFLPRALTVAGSDSGGGAGIQADLKTMQELGVFGMSAITAVTAQNSLGVRGVWPLPPEAVAAQIDAVLGDIGAGAVKTGMLHDAAVIETVADALERHPVPSLIVDPVMVAKSGDRLLREDAIDALKRRLLPMAELVTPNLPEASALLGIPEGAIRTEREMVEAARGLLALGVRNVLLKGGHLPASGGVCIDVLCGADAPEPVVIAAPRVATPHTHGTGCTLSAAVAALRAKGLPLAEAVRTARNFLGEAIAQAVPTGAGVGSLWHAAHRMKSPATAES